MKIENFGMIRFFLILILILSFSSCRQEEDYEYKGINYLLLRADKQIIYDTNGMGGTMTARVVLSKLLQQDLKLNFSIEQEDTFCELEASEIIIPTGERYADLIITAKKEGELEQEKDLTLKLDNSSDESVKLKEVVGFKILPLQNKPLSEEEKKLVEHYKKDPIDSLYVSLLGKKEVSLMVKFPGDANFVDFPAAGEQEIKSTTIFALSEKATKDKLVLKMVHNAMGVNDFLYKTLSNMTHKNSFWRGEGGKPGALAENAIRLIDFEKFKYFNVMLDDLEREGELLKFIGEINAKYSTNNSKSEKINAVPFTYSYSAWDELQKQMEIDLEFKAFIKELKEEQPDWDPAYADGTLNPEYFLNKDDILENMHKNGTLFTKPEVHFDKTNFVLSFTFCLSYNEPDDYVQFKASYQLEK